MLTAALLSVALLIGGPSKKAIVAGTAGAPAKVSGTSMQRQAREIRDLSGKRLGSEADIEAALGGTYSSALAPRTRATPFLNRVYEVTLNIPDSMWEEKFLIGVPKYPLAPAPLLVAFHGYGNSHFDISANTKYFQRALARGWYVVAPLGAHKFSYGIDYAQDNVEAVLDWVVTHFNIDWERIYGVGFSMGGGFAAGYAARHLDPTKPRFAAVLDHTGSVSIRDVWAHAIDKSLLEHPLMFQGPPSQYPFRYQTASSIDLDAAGYVDPLSDLARNLVHTPSKLFAALNDPLQHLVVQTTILHSHLSLLGGQCVLELVAGYEHKWSTLNETAALDWLMQFTRMDPAAGTPVQVLADRSASYWGFQIVQKFTGTFTPFRWTLDLVNKRITLDQFSNVRIVRFLPEQIGLDVGASPIEIMINLVGQTGVDIVLEGFPTAPTSVTRTGNPSPSWSWDPVEDTVTLNETYGVGYPRWTVTR